MNLARKTFIIFLLSLSVSRKNAVAKDLVAGYAPGVSGMVSINEANCLNDEIRMNANIANALECARTCRSGEPKTCYYKFVVERYAVNGHGCDLCMPNITNTLCANCQCVPANGEQRMATTVNRMIPGPSIQVCLGDRVIVDVENRLQTESLTIHWHGLFQERTQHFDGVPYMTQCPILFNNEFRYEFYANNGGTHFWHSHTGSLKLDGIFGSFIIREPEENEPHSDLYDFDLANHVIIINDWMNEESTSKLPGRRAGEFGQLADEFLINGKGRFNDVTGSTTSVPFEVITVDANGRFRFRLINSFCTICSGELTIEDHNMTIIASDGHPIKPITVNSIVSLAGERYDFVVNTNRQPGAYWIQLRALHNCGSRPIQQLAILQYLGASSTPQTEEPTYENPLPAGIIMNFGASNCNGSPDGTVCISDINSALEVDPGIIKGEPDVRLEISINSINYAHEEIYLPNTYKNFFIPRPNRTVIDTLNNISFVSPHVPLLSQFKDVSESQLCNAESLPKNCNSTICTCTHVIQIPLDAVVQITVTDEMRIPFLAHPFHLHGYLYHVMSIGEINDPNANTIPKRLAYLRELERANQLPMNTKSPPGKDTVVVPSGGYVILRFRASNPGFWLFHCHIAFHQLAGMELTLQVGEPKDMPTNPKDFPKCGVYKPKIR